MRIATWNINGLQARLGFVLHWLQAREPDLVCLQELKLEGDKFPHSVFEAEGYQALVHGQKAWNGVAILSRNKGKLLQQGLPGAEEMGARLLTAQFQNLSITSVYCPNGKSLEHPDFQTKLEWLEQLDRYLNAEISNRQPYLLGGDFNLCPQPIDSWNEEKLKGRIFHTDEERAAFQKFEAWGLHDLYRRLHPDHQMFSWWDYRAGAFHRNHGLRIDFLLATDPLADALRDIQIDRDYRKKKEGMIASDHAPVIADIDL